MWCKNEFSSKVNKVRKFIQEKNLDALRIRQQVNLFWFTGARPYVNMIGDSGCFEMVVTADKVYLVTNNIEAPRLQDEELKNFTGEIITFNWWDSDANKVCSELLQGKKVADDSIAGFANLRFVMVSQEVERFRILGKKAGEALDEVAIAIKPEQTEQEIANMIRCTCQNKGIDPFVTLVGTDERIFKYRHPLPTDKKLKNYALLAISARAHGQYASITRMIHFGKLPTEIAEKHIAVQKIDAAFILSTVPKAIVKDVFQKGVNQYKETGFADEWQNHHQGGLAGYNSREFRGTFTCDEIVEEHQIYAWNPTISGAKSEDTVLITANGAEILTKSAYYPQTAVEYNGKTINRADILIR